MKRDAALAGLSREHHSALVMAQRIATGGLLMADLAARFEQELEPHFQAEEQVLLPLLESAGAEGLAHRAHQEHQQLRQLATAVAAGDSAALTAFGIALRDHVRFEERELFVAAEALLLPEQLLALARRLDPPLSI